MGQAKRRGTFEERKKIALDKKSRLLSEIKRRQVIKVGTGSLLIAALALMAKDMVIK